MVENPSDFKERFLGPGEFWYHEKLIKKTPTSLCCLSNQSKIRKFCIYITEHFYFESFIFTCILVNSISMAMFDYSYVEILCEEESKLNNLLETIGHCFGFIFSIESLIKIIAVGAILDKKTYFRSVWNILDFIIVVSFILEYSFKDG